MKKYLLLITLIGFSILSYASLPIHVDSLKIFKTNDTSFYFVAYGVGVPSSGCGLIDSAKYIGSDSINLFLCYKGGSQSALCQSTDTLYLGNLTTTNYTLVLNIAIVAGITATCSNPWNKDTFQFNYSTVGINEIDFYRQVKLYPNPATHHITLTTAIALHNPNATITTTTGSIVMQTTLTNPNKNEIDISALPAGLYFLSLQSESERVVRRFVKE